MQHSISKLSEVGCRCLRLLAFGVLALVSTAAPADELTDRVAAALDRADPSLQATIHAQDEIQIKGAAGPSTIFLDHVRAECAKRTEGCDTAIQGFVKSVVATAHLADLREFKPEKVFPIIRPESQVESMRPVVGDDPKKLFVAQPYISGAVVMYAIDTPNAIRFVNNSDLEKSGLTIEALDKIARSHLSQLSPVDIQPMSGAPGFFTIITQDGYATSRLFDSKFWTAVEARVGGPAAVALPTRDWLLAVRLDDAEAVRRLRMVARRIASGEPHAVTAALVRRDGTGWAEVPR